MHNEYGEKILNESDVLELMYSNPTANLRGINIVGPSVDLYNAAVNELFLEYTPLTEYIKPTVSIAEFDKEKQAIWHMPDAYKSLDIAEYILGLCNDNETALQRAGVELIEFQKLDFFNALRFLKYMVDTMRENDIVWGVGRGSSTASYVLFLLGIHKIDSIKYQLDFQDFIKQND